MIHDEETPYEVCKDCFYYYGEIDECMVGEPDVPSNFPQKCKDKGGDTNDNLDI